jgi:hypothetical protein
MQEHFGQDNSFSRQVIRALFPEGQQARSAFLVPSLFEHLAKLPVLAAARKRVDVAAELYKPVFAMAHSVLNELGNWASVFVAFGASQDSPMTQEAWTQLRDAAITMLDLFDPAAGPMKEALPIEPMQAARLLLAYLETHRCGELKRLFFLFCSVVVVVDGGCVKIVSTF